MSASGETTSADDDNSSSLDHVLLESLFYNEMLMLNENSPTSSNFVQQLNEVTQPRHHQAAVDPNTQLEKELLQDFGVHNSGPSPLSLPGAAHSPVAMHPTTHSWPPNPATAQTHSAHVHHMPPQEHLHYEQQHPGPQYQMPPPPPSHSTSVMASSVPVQPLTTATPATSHPHPSVHHQHHATKPPVPPLSVETPLPAPSASSSSAPQLVDQFITLASRLGIEVPSMVLQSLTGQGSASNGNTPSLTRSSSQWSSTSLVTMSASNDEDRKEAPGHAKRRASDTAIPSTMDTASAPVASSYADTDKTESKHKRRKKAKLEDCESRLAELKAENEMLQRHLQNVSRKTHRFEQEKQQAGARIQELLRENAGEEEMNKAVDAFDEMYSDYGLNRQQELSFHLEQLQRLVNPSNFTKMGLWTMGHNSISPKRNPIAGILQKELDITPQQGKKILDHSKRIRDLCENLKECLALLATLKSLCEQKTKIFHDRIEKCREILTGKQVVKLIAWIHDHTQLLETVCPGWGTEHIHS
eukprot:Nitzschia sp. Nitz4//scaffold9_size221794//49079//50746//NITZ4_001329-RA/size221794-snap-gene-0.91-mRNA-1//1//CDS//3329560950//102//frame0